MICFYCQSISGKIVGLNCTSNIHACSGSLFHLVPCASERRDFLYQNIRAMNQSNFNLEFKRVVDLSICPETPTGIDKVITGYDIDDEN